MHISRKITSYGYIRISNGIFKKAINYQVFLVSLLLWWGLLKLKYILSTTKFILDKILPTIRKIIFEEAGVVEQFGTLGAPQTSLVINRIVHSKMRSLSDLAVTSHANHIFFYLLKPIVSIIRLYFTVRRISASDWCTTLERHHWKAYYTRAPFRTESWSL